MRGIKGIGLWLKERRQESGLTQHEVAVKTLGHSTAQYISNLERGLCEPSVKMARVLCETYGGSKKELYELYLKKCEELLKEDLFPKPKKRKA